MFKRNNWYPLNHFVLAHGLIEIPDWIFLRGLNSCNTELGCLETELSKNSSFWTEVLKTMALFWRFVKLLGKPTKTLQLYMSNLNKSWIVLPLVTKCTEQFHIYFFSADNCIKVLEPDQKVVLQTVEVLGLHNNEISSITKEFLKSFPSLWKLRLFNNKILHFSDDLFIHNRWGAKN